MRECLNVLTNNNPEFHRISKKTHTFARRNKRTSNTLTGRNGTRKNSNIFGNIIDNCQISCNFASIKNKNILY